MIDRGLGEQSRLLTYVLLIGRALSTLAEIREHMGLRQLGVPAHDAAYDATASRPWTLTASQRMRLEEVANHLRRAADTQNLLDAAPGQRLPDLETLRVYQAVYEAVALARVRPGTRVAETVLELIATLEGILEGSPGATADTERLDDLERVLDRLATIYSRRTERGVEADDFESLLRWPKPLHSWM